MHSLPASSPHGAQAPFPSFFPAPAAFGANWPERFRVKSPVVDVSEDDKELVVKAEVPGMSEKDLELSWLDGVLYVKGEKKEEKEDKSRKNTWHRESWYGSFTRGIPLARTRTSPRPRPSTRTAW